jgi:hypothetical protein
MLWMTITIESARFGSGSPKNMQRDRYNERRVTNQKGGVTKDFWSKARELGYIAIEPRGSNHETLSDCSNFVSRL